MIFLFLSLLGGIIFLSLGATGLVRGASTLAYRMGISPLVIGLTLVGWGTSAPEFITMLQSVARGVPGITVGDLIGSNILNILGVLGICALVRPFRVDATTLNRHGSVLLIVTAAAAATFYFYPVIPRVAGIGALALLILHTVLTYRVEMQKPRLNQHLDEHIATRGILAHPLAASSMAAAGLLGLTLGASLMVDAATQLAVIFGVSHTVIGLTIVALGTTLPEIFTAIAAALHRQTSMAVGTVIGSNMFNLLGILGTASIFTKIPLTPAITSLSMWFMLGAAAALLIYARGKKFKRAEAILFLAAYAVYVGLLLYHHQPAF